MPHPQDGFHGNTSKIIIYPSDFVGQDPRGGTSYLVYSVNGVYLRTGGDVLFDVKIPVGFKVTKLYIYSATNTSILLDRVVFSTGAISSVPINGGASGTTNSINTLDSPVVYDTGSYLRVTVTGSHSSNAIRGGYVEITPL